MTGNYIRQAVEQARKAQPGSRLGWGMVLFLPDSPHPTTMSTSDPVTRHLLKLAELADAGVLTEEEFEAKKAEVLKLAVEGELEPQQGPQKDQEEQWGTGVLSRPETVDSRDANGMTSDAKSQRDSGQAEQEREPEPPEEPKSKGIDKDYSWGDYAAEFRKLTLDEQRREWDRLDARLKKLVEEKTGISGPVPPPPPLAGLKKTETTPAPEVAKPAASQKQNFMKGCLALIGISAVLSVCFSYIGKDSQSCEEFVAGIPKQPFSERDQEILNEILRTSEPEELVYRRMAKRYGITAAAAEQAARRAHEGQFSRWGRERDDAVKKAVRCYVKQRGLNLLGSPTINGGHVIIMVNSGRVATDEMQPLAQSILRLPGIVLARIDLRHNQKRIALRDYR